VYYFHGKVGMGKIDSFESCCHDAMTRDSFGDRRQRFLQGLPQAEKDRLRELDSTQRDDAKGDEPGSERGDEEERLFMASLSDEDRAFLEGHKGLGNSQKAEVAWLEKCGYPYEECDVRDFDMGAANSASRHAAWPGLFWKGSSFFGQRPSTAST
jgi:hypothetical protein